MDSESWIALASLFVIGYIVLNFYNGVCYAITLRKSQMYDIAHDRLFANSEALQRKTEEQNERFDEILTRHESLLNRAEAIVAKIESSRRF